MCNGPLLSCPGPESVDKSSGEAKLCRQPALFKWLRMLHFGHLFLFVNTAAPGLIIHHQHTLRAVVLVHIPCRRHPSKIEKKDIRLC